VVVGGEDDDGMHVPRVPAVHSAVVRTDGGEAAADHRLRRGAS